MAESINASANAGSASDPVHNQATGAPTGESQKATGAQPQNSEELLKLVGKQGQELGEYRQFIQSISPILDQLEKQPALLQAIVNGKIDDNLAKAVLDGKVTLSEAETVQKAQDAIKDEFGAEGLKNLDSKQIEKLIEERVQLLRKDFEERTDAKAFEEKTQSFISNTSDFQEYADKVDEWLDEHPDVVDIEVAYYAVKGKLSEAKAREAADKAAADANQYAVSNATGGDSGAKTFVEANEQVLDALISKRPNPNKLF